MQTRRSDPAKKWPNYPTHFGILHENFSIDFAAFSAKVLSHESGRLIYKDQGLGLDPKANINNLTRVLILRGLASPDHPSSDVQRDLSTAFVAPQRFSHPHFPLYGVHVNPVGMAEDEDPIGEKSAAETLLALLNDDVYLNRVSHAKESTQLEALLRVALKEDASLLSSLDITNTSRPPYSLFLIIKVTAAILSSLPKPTEEVTKVVDPQLFAFEELRKSGVKPKLMLKAKDLMVHSATRFPALYRARVKALKVVSVYPVLVEAAAKEESLREDLVKDLVAQASLEGPWLQALEMLLGQLQVEEYEKQVEPRLTEWLKGDVSQVLAVVQAVVKQSRFALGEATFRQCVPVLVKMLYAEDDIVEDGSPSVPAVARKTLAGLADRGNSVNVLYVLEEINVVLRGKGPQGKQVSVSLELWDMLDVCVMLRPWHKLDHELALSSAWTAWHVWWRTGEK